MRLRRVYRSLLSAFDPHHATVIEGEALDVAARQEMVALGEGFQRLFRDRVEVIIGKQALGDGTDGDLLTEDFIS